MKLFKDIRNGFEELLSMYPSYYSNVYEMLEILKAHGRLSDQLKTDIQQVFFNQFINEADSNAISEFERILNLNSSSKSLDERRRIVKACLTSSGQLSASMITDIIKAYTDADATITFEQEAYMVDFHTLTINAERGGGDVINISEVIKLISNKIPAHIFYNLTWNYEFSLAVETIFEVYNSDVPKCGLYACGQDIPF
ncbi:MAG: DUF2313 domain-containing protein [Ruminococcus sp.]|nr:DUF2313 domain-containing protein [Ruminococcus sp.]